MAVSTITIGQNLGNALAPIGGSFLVESFGYEGMFCGMGVATLVIGWLLLFWNFGRNGQDSSNQNTYQRVQNVLGSFCFFAGKWPDLFCFRRTFVDEKVAVLEGE